MLAVSWLGFLRWLATLPIALVVAAMVLVLYLSHVSGSGGGGGDL
jgi:hypothetical protein